MKIITRQSRANQVLERWKSQYWDKINNKFYGNKYEIYLLLKKLDNPDPDKIDKIIGNNTWTQVPECTECGSRGDMVVQIGDCDYDEECAYICKKCLTEINKISKGY